MTRLLLTPHRSPPTSQAGRSSQGIWTKLRPTVTADHSSFALSSFSALALFRLNMRPCSCDTLCHPVKPLPEPFSVMHNPRRALVTLTMTRLSEIRYFGGPFKKCCQVDLDTLMPRKKRNVSQNCCLAPQKSWESPPKVNTFIVNTPARPFKGFYRLNLEIVQSF